MSPSTGARKVGGLASTTRSPNVSNVFSHIRPPHTATTSNTQRFDDWGEEEEESSNLPHLISDHFKRYELMTELYVDYLL